MVSKRKFKRDYIILEAKDMNFRSKERVLPKAFAKIEINDEKSVVALYVENLKNLKDGYDVIALRTDYERLNLGRINLNSQGKGEFVLDLNEEDSDIKAIALTYEKYVPLIGFKGNKIENYEELIFEPEEEIIEYVEADEEDDRSDYEVYEEVEYIDPENGGYEYEEIEYIYEDDLGEDDIEENEEQDVEMQQEQQPVSESEAESQQIEENQQEQEPAQVEEYEYIEYEEITNQEPEYEYEYEEIEEEDEDETEDIPVEPGPGPVIKPKKECAKPLQLPKEERDNNKSKQQKQNYKDKNPTKRKNAKQEQYSNPKVIQKNNTEFEEKISAGKLLMPRQIKKGLKYFKEVKPFAADYIPNTRWWKIEITPTTMSGYTMPYLGYVNSLNYTMYSDIAMNSYKYRHYLFGVQYDEYNKRKNYIYAIPGKKSEQPDKGTTGFTTYQACDNRSSSLGYRMCFIDSKARKIEK